MFALRFSGICVTVAKGTRFGHLLFFLKEVSLLRFYVLQSFFSCLLTGFPFLVYFCIDCCCNSSIFAGGGPMCSRDRFALRPLPQIM